MFHFNLLDIETPWERLFYTVNMSRFVGIWLQNSLALQLQTGGPRISYSLHQTECIVINKKWKIKSPHKPDAQLCYQNAPANIYAVCDVGVVPSHKVVFTTNFEGGGSQALQKTAFQQRSDGFRTHEKSGEDEGYVWWYIG